MLYGVEAQDPATAAASPGGSYAAHGVHFAGSLQGDGTTYLRTASLSCTDNGYFAFSLWNKGLVTTGDDNNFAVVFVSDEAGDYVSYLELHFFGPGGTGAPQWHLGTTVQSTDIGFTKPSVGPWHHFLGAGYVNANPHVMVLYIDDVLQTPASFSVGSVAVLNSINGKSFMFGDDTFSDGPTCDFADVWIAPGVSLLSGSTIPEATRRQFIDAGGNPVDPTTWPTSAIQFYGDAASFPTNHGTGGAFTLTGSLTNAATNPP